MSAKLGSDGCNPSAQCSNFSSVEGLIARMARTIRIADVLAVKGKTELLACPIFRRRVLFVSQKFGHSKLYWDSEFR